MFASLRQRLSDLASNFGPATPIKSLRSAIAAGEEDKAIEIYIGTVTNDINGTLESDGNSKKVARALAEDLHPSMPFSSKKFWYFISFCNPPLCKKVASFHIL